ncbi:8882_t:CDS:2, partial [Cetraspora pellucida]
MLSSWYATAMKSLPIFTSNQNVENESKDIVICYNKNFIDISLNNKWNNNKVKNAGLSKNLDVKHLFFQDFHRAYANYLNLKVAILHKNIEFYNSITYTVLENNQDSIR